MKQCGSCSLCCKVLGVSALEKPGGSWCRHCNKGVGCGIYETRPTECRTFSCLWLSDPAFPADLKPDRTKVIFAVELDGARICAYVDPDDPTAWRKPSMLALLKRMAVLQAQRRGQVIVFIKERAIAVLPDREVDLGDAVKKGADIRYRVDPFTGRIEVKVAPLPA